VTALKPIEGSSNIVSAGYDQASQTLSVVFKNGKRYDYQGVPQETADDFDTADSKGKFLAENVKGQFEFTSQDVDAAGEE
jgi:hypothetical protein